MTSKYYVIAEVDTEKPLNPHSNKWPKLIAYSFETMKILIIEGRGHGLMGGELSISKFDVSQWGYIFSETDTEWFRKIIESGLLSDKNNEDAFIKVLSGKIKVRAINY